MPVIPARKAVAFSVAAGQQIKIVNTHGKQVLDFWAFNPRDPHDYLSMVHTRTVLAAVVLKRGNALYSTRRRAMLTLVEDTTTDGMHDLVWSACDAERYHMQGFAGYHDNCTDNMHAAVAAHAPPGFALAADWVPDPLNLFMNVAIDHYGKLDVRPPTSEAGQRVVLRAETDLLVVISSCPQDLAPVNAGMPTDCEYEVLEGSSSDNVPAPQKALVPAASAPPLPRKRKVKIALSVDFDAVSHWLGTGCHADNNMADYSSGIFAGQVGVHRLLDLFRRHGVADKMTWFVPGHTAETFPAAAQAVVQSGAEIGLHGYAHEGIYQMTEEQERDVLLKCIDVATKLTGKKPRGYRAPMYTVRETTVQLLRAHGFLYDSSMMHHDSQPYFAPSDPPIAPVDFSRPAASWLRPSAVAPPPAWPRAGEAPLVELPCGWYNEDMMPLMYLPHLSNSMGYVPTRAVEQMWQDKFVWLWEQAARPDFAEGGASADFVFPLLVHPDVSGLAHVLPMIDRFLAWLRTFGGDSVAFCKCEDIAAAWLEEQAARRSCT